MKVLFKNVTQYTKETCNDFIEFHSNKYFKTDFLKFILKILVIGYIFIYNIVHINIKVIGIILLLIGIYIVYEKKEFIKSKFFFKNKYKSTNKEHNNEVINNSIVQNSLIVINKRKEKKIKKARSTENFYYFYFYDKYMKIKHKKNAKRVKYFKFNKVYETDDYFFIYIEDKEPWMLKKDGFEVGTSEKFSKFIKKKCIFRYKDEELRNL